ncbi:hypothetical protein JCM19235_6457 [Vibrio maritimus]|uniref:Uncharacterized protein n=1 Tax=Vibrio maritimus TaxID=990268 RepID=A0A090RUL5_9VIBR|nr:hypothetical protein JCM19235_6457 [Vibrio maritimus]
MILLHVKREHFDQILTIELFGRNIYRNVKVVREIRHPLLNLKTQALN